MKLKELRAKWAQLVSEERSQLERLQKEGRSLDATEAEQYEKRKAEIEKLESEIKAEERMEDAMRNNADRSRQAEELRGQPERPGASGTPSKPEGSGKIAEARAAFGAWLRGGVQSLSDVEMRALSATPLTSGGALIAPQAMAMELIKFVDDLVFVRGLATKYTVDKAESLGAPSLDADPADADWTSELATGSEDSTMAFGKRELVPNPLAKLIKVSNKLLRQSSMDPVALVMQRLAYKFAITQEKAFLTGNGASQPLGLFTANASGISTGRDVSTGNTTTAVTFDGLMEAVGALKTQYQNSAATRWLFHRTTMTMIRKLKDSQNRYLLDISTANGSVPANILGFPYMLSEYVPNTYTTGLYVGIIGDFSKYWIADAMSMQVQRLNELYAATNQTGFIARLETDGMPVLEEAFVRVKLA